MSRAAIFLAGPGNASDQYREIDTLPAALDVAQSAGPGAWAFNLASPPSLDFPLLKISVAGLNVVTNRVAGVLAVACDTVMIEGPGGACSVDVDRTSVQNAEMSVYVASGGIFGRAWLEGLGPTAASVWHSRQLRLELLHCLALRLCETEALAELGEIIDMRISNMALNPLKATRPSSSGQGLC